MAQELTILTRTVVRQQSITPNLVLKIDGIDLIFGYVDLMKAARYGEDGIMYGDPGLVYGGTVKESTSRDYVILDKSSNSITQQLLQDKGAASSVSNVKIALIDVNDSLTALFQPGAVIDDILGRDAEVFLNFGGTRFPEDAISIFYGLLADIDFGAGNCILNVTHPDQLKRQEVFVKAQTQLNGAINSSVTSLSVDVGSDFFEPTETFKTYLKIGDEIIQYTSVSGTTISGLTRGALNTVAASHSDNDEVESFYSITGDAIDLALKMMLSNPDTAIFASGSFVAANFEAPFGGVGSLIPNTRAITFLGDDILSYGIGAGDTFNIVLNPPKATYELPFALTLVSLEQRGDYVTAFFEEEIYHEFTPNPAINAGILKSPGTYTAGSRYNEWPDGLRMKVSQVDIIQHLKYKQLFGSSYPQMTIYLKDSIEGKEVIEKDIYFPNGLYALPRGGKSSVGMTLPPLAQFETAILDERNITNLADIKIKRSLNKNFYNSVVYRYNEDSLEEKLLNGKVTVSQESINRIPIKNNPLKIEARGFRKDEATENLIDRQSQRFLDRYKYGTEFIENVEVLLGDGFNIEVGDVVIFGSPNMKLSDSSTGTRNFTPRIFEVINRSLNIKTGKLSFTLLNTSFSLDGRYGVISPSSYVESSSAGKIKVRVSFSTVGTNELVKWSDYVGLRLNIHNEDWSTLETVTLTGFDPSNVNTMLVSGMTVTPSDGWLVDVATYGNGDKEENALLKRLHCYYNPQEEVAIGYTFFRFDVTDSSRLFVGAFIRVHSVDYSDYSPQAKILEIDGDEITVDTSLGFTPAAGMLVELIGFINDEGQPYLYI